MRTSLFVRGGSAFVLVFALLGGAAHADENTAEAAYTTGVEALRTHDYAGAVTAFEEAARLRPEHVDTWLKLGIAHSALQDWDEAIEAYGRVTVLDPNDAIAHHNIGNVHFRRGAFAEAEREYARALEIDPDYLLAAFHHGWTLRQLGRNEQAEAAFRRCLDVAGDDPDAMRTRVDCLFGLGSMRHRAGDYEASARMMEQVLSVYRGHPEARYYLGMAYRQLGRLEDAAQQLEIHRQMLNVRRQPMPTFDDPDRP